jgi:multiple sugar transport system permease protein/putative aldouronate transport system permease protein
MANTGRYTLRSRIGFNFYDVFVYAFTGAFGLICLYPLWYVIIGSLNPGTSVAAQKIALLPTNGVSFDCYVVIVMGKVFQRSILISVSKTLLASCCRSS